MTAKFYIKRGDTSPALKAMLESDPAPNITGASARFQMWRRGTRELIVDRVATLLAGPIAQHDWQAADTTTAGQYEAEFRVTYADGGIETFPNSGFIPVVIGEDVR